MKDSKRVILLSVALFFLFAFANSYGQANPERLADLKLDPDTINKLAGKWEMKILEDGSEGMSGKLEFQNVKVCDVALEEGNAATPKLAGYKCVIYNPQNESFEGAYSFIKSAKTNKVYYVFLNCQKNRREMVLEVEFTDKDNVKMTKVKLGDAQQIGARDLSYILTLKRAPQ